MIINLTVKVICVSADQFAVICCINPPSPTRPHRISQFYSVPGWKKHLADQLGALGSGISIFENDLQAITGRISDPSVKYVPIGAKV
jgi:hypothetical protein